MKTATTAHLPRLVAFWLVLTLSAAGAEEAKESTPTADAMPAPAVNPLLNPPSTAPTSPPTTGRALPIERPRLVSPDIAAKVSANRPTFAPKPETKAREELPDLRETDKPRNGIIRLPAYIVREPKQPVLKERDLLTSYGKLLEAYRRYSGLRFLGNRKVALAMLEEELRLERLTEMMDLVSLLSITDRPGANSVYKEALGSFRRPQTWVESRGSGWAEYNARRR